MTALSGDNRRFDCDLDQTTVPFEAMTRCNDLRQLKLKLAAEVGALKRTALKGSGAGNRPLRSSSGARHRSRNSW